MIDEPDNAPDSATDNVTAQADDTAQDQAGLMAVLTAIQVQGADFVPTRFEFENGSVLTITAQNYQEFMAEWLPFRQSFFRAG